MPVMKFLDPDTESAVRDFLARIPAAIRLDQAILFVPLRDRNAFSTLYLAFRERDRNAHLRGLLSKLREQPKIRRMGG
jgi:hypothetical protein